MDLISFMLVVWVIKVIAEDGWATAKGQSNPRIERRKARQKSRANNPIWQQFVGYLGDLAEDARQEQDRKRKERRAREERERKNAEAVEAEVVEDDIQDAEVVDPGSTSPESGGYNPDPDDPSVVDVKTTLSQEDYQKEEHAKLSDEECAWPRCPVHNQPKQNTGDAPNQSNEGDDMNETQGLDQAIAYAEAVAKMAEKHGTAGNEGYIGHLTERSVSGEALASAYEMQAAMSAAMAAAEHHKSELEKQKAVQEAYDANPDAGDQEFQTAGR